MFKTSSLLITACVSVFSFLGVAVVAPALSDSFVANAQTPVEDAKKGITGVTGGTSNVEDVVKTIINILLFLVGMIAVIMLILGGIKYAASGGDANATAGAKNTIIYAIVGLVVAFVAWSVVRFIVFRLNTPPLSCPAGQHEVVDAAGVQSCVAD